MRSLREIYNDDGTVTCTLVDDESGSAEVTAEWTASVGPTGAVSDPEDVG